MSTTPELPATIDPNRPSAARIYDAFLGGTHNFAADRAVAARAVELVPELPEIAQANRAFLQRAVRYATGHGIRQFLDLGSGIPTERNVHEVAREAVPDARVVYVDIDPAAVLYARHLLGEEPGITVVHGDLQQPEVLLAEPAVRGLLDLSLPVAVLMVSVLHFVSDGPGIEAALSAYREAVVPGSQLAVTHATTSARPDAMERVADLYTRTGTALVPRDEEEVARFFAGWELVEPGLVYGQLWRPEQASAQDPSRYLTLAGVGVR
ncbi:SAM-dependent methyltransferase [Actinoplanes sp. GCM10030250]|uniref:SAM-dependent methyltransferase n=1 Tax=Actinoplanes sp. GCM10030250 TaxID=3273376 RepID=UPI0036203150